MAGRKLKGPGQILSTDRRRMTRSEPSRIGACIAKTIEELFIDLCAGKSAKVSKQPVGRHGQPSTVTSRKSSSVLFAEKSSSRLGCRRSFFSTEMHRNWVIDGSAVIGPELLVSFRLRSRSRNFRYNSRTTPSIGLRQATVLFAASKAGA